MQREWLVLQDLPQGGRGAHRLLLHGVRASTSACPSTRAASASWPAITSRPRAIWACRSWAWASPMPKATSARCSTPTAGGARAIPINDWAPHAGPAGAGGRGQQTHGHPRAISPRASCSRSCGRCRWAESRCSFSMPTSRRTRPRPRSITGRSTAAIRSSACVRRSCFGIGGTHALEAVGFSPTVCHMNEGHSAFLTVERIGLRHARASRQLRRRRRGPQRGEHLHDAHACPRRQRRFRSPARAPLPGALPRRARHLRRRGALARARRSARRQRALLHARPRHAHRRPLQRRQRAPRRGLAQDVAGPLARSPDARDPHRLHHQWRAHALVDRRRAGRAFHPLPGASVGRASRRPRAVAARVRDPGRRALAGARAPAQPPGAACAAVAERRGGPARGGARRARADGRGARSARADHRLRAALRHLQAGGASLHRSGAREEAPRRRSAPGAAGLRRQGAPAGQGGQGAHSLPSRWPAATRVCAGAWSSSRTTTCASRVPWSAASTCG